MPFHCGCSWAQQSAMCLQKSQPNPSDSNVAQFLWAQGCVFVAIFHLDRLVIIRLEIASEAVCSLVALVTTWAQRLS